MTSCNQTFCIDSDVLYRKLPPSGRLDNALEETHMAGLPPYPDSTGDDSGAEAGRGSTTGTPRWVKVFGLIALTLVLLFVIMLLTGGHGPGRHM